MTSAFYSALSPPPLSMPPSIRMTPEQAKSLLAKQRAQKQPAHRTHRFAGLNRGLVRTRGEMNATERRYANELESRRLAGEIADWWFEPFSLRLTHPPEGQPARVTVDFMVLMPSGLVFLDDTKGSGLDNPASIVALKCAAELFPLWRFRIVKERTKKQGGGWEVREL